MGFDVSSIDGLDLQRKKYFYDKLVNSGVPLPKDFATQDFETLYLKYVNEGRIADASNGVDGVDGVDGARGDKGDKGDKGDPTGIDLSAPFKRKPRFNLDFRYPDYAETTTKYGSSYPQGFDVDVKNNLLFIINMSDSGVGSHHVITVYNWITGAYISYFAVPATYVSESVVVKWEGAKRYLYYRHSANLVRVDITTLPPNRTELTIANTYTVQTSKNFSYRNGHWTFADAGSTLGTLASRSLYKRMDDSFAYEGVLTFADKYAGGNQAEYEASVIPKMQGFDEGLGCFAFGIGGFARKTDSFNLYGLNGTRILGADGTLAMEALCDPQKVMTILAENGYTNDRLESEGVRYINNKLFSLQVIGLGSVGGVLILEEMSNDPTAIDFSSSAYSYTVPNTDLVQSGMYPRSHNNRMRNLLTGEELTTMAQTLKYMRSSGMSVMRFYSSNGSLIDINGSTSIPTGILVTLINANNATFRVEFQTDNVEWAGTWNYFYNSTADTFTKNRLATGLIVKSPNGTRYTITVDNSGVLSTIASTI